MPSVPLFAPGDFPRIAGSPTPAALCSWKAPMPSKLEQLRAMTVVVADTGDLEAVRRLKPQDCTTNPTLLLKAAGTPAYRAIVDEALSWGRRQGGARDAVAAAVCDRLAVAVGAELAGVVPGRVSTEVDA